MNTRLARNASLGRFELREQLGQGAQATVWLAFDPRLERQVALKVLRPDAQVGPLASWLHEARMVGRLNHPNIVPVFEADIQDDVPYLVFEYVPGGTLAQRLAAVGPMAPRVAAELMIGVLDALHAAHEQGIVHRDLKPSNVLLDSHGQARVMDFGIAATMADRASSPAHSGLVVGTPAYMSPQAALAEPAAPAMDIFAAGAMLGGLIAGEPLRHDSDPARALGRAASEPLTLPAQTASAMGEALCAIVTRAIAFDPAQRPASAKELRDALQHWLTPAVDPVGPDSGNATLDFLLRRIRVKGDFPALSSAMVRIQRVVESEDENLGALSSAILEDVALTNKLLRLVNTASYRHAGGGTISTVSRAVALVGFAGIRKMAVSLVLLEHMPDRSRARRLQEEFLRSLLAASLADELCASRRDSEEAFIAALFQNLGRLLAGFYFPEEFDEVCQATAHAPTGDRSGEQAAARRVLGASFEELGVGVARSWGLPQSLQHAMSCNGGTPASRVPERREERLRWLATAANQVADAMLHTDAVGLPARLQSIAARFGRAVDVKPKQLEEAVVVARARLSDMVAGMDLDPSSSSTLGRLLVPPPQPHRSGEDSLSPLELHAATLALPDSRLAQPQGTVAQPPREQRATTLAAGVQEITDTMAGEGFRLDAVLRMILETMLRGLDLGRVVFCLRDAKADVLTGRFGLGEGADALVRKFQVALRPAADPGADLFTAVCIKGVDTLISDATLPNIAQRLPDWYRRQVDAAAFLLLPLHLKGRAFALIYADRAGSSGIDLDEKELSLLKTLRNQAVMAFRQAG